MKLGQYGSVGITIGKSKGIYNDRLIAEEIRDKILDSLASFYTLNMDWLSLQKCSEDKDLLKINFHIDKEDIQVTEKDTIEVEGLLKEDEIKDTIERVLTNTNVFNFDIMPLSNMIVSFNLDKEEDLIAVYDDAIHNPGFNPLEIDR